MSTLETNAARQQENAIAIYDLLASLYPDASGPNLFLQGVESLFMSERTRDIVPSGWRYNNKVGPMELVRDIALIRSRIAVPMEFECTISAETNDDGSYGTSVEVRFDLSDDEGDVGVSCYGEENVVIADDVSDERISRLVASHFGSSVNTWVGADVPSKEVVEHFGSLVYLVFMEHADQCYFAQCDEFVFCGLDVVGLKIQPVL
jgi:hypothetical protein